MPSIVSARNAKEETVDFGDIEELIRILETSGLTEIEIEQDGHRIRLTKQLPPAAMVTAPVTVPVQGSGAVAPEAEVPEDDGLQLEPGMLTIDSPMVGTFYSSPAPGEPLFVQLNDQVEAEQTVCIVEAMKIMNEVVAKQPGVIVKALVENGESIEFGQPLFVIRPF